MSEKRIIVADGEAVWFVCPGCLIGPSENGLHRLPLDVWTWNGSLDAPTIRASVLTRGGSASADFVCHSFITDGQIKFLEDSTHALAGKTVPLPPLPDWFKS